jgi:hypothetical protein
VRFAAPQRSLQSNWTMGWVVLTYKLPGDGSSARVAVWREVRRSGALQVQRSVVAFPDEPAFHRAVERFRALVAEVGGQTVAVRAEPYSDGDGARLLEAWNAARDAEYAELTAECGKFLAEIDHEFEIGKFTLAELEEEESELEKLERWHARVTGRDVHQAAGSGAAAGRLAEARHALDRYSAAVFERTQP